MTSYPSAWVALGMVGCNRERLRKLWPVASKEQRAAITVIAVYMGWMAPPDDYLAGLYGNKTQENTQEV